EKRVPQRGGIMTLTRPAFLASIALLLTTAIASADKPLLDKTVTGTPEIKSIDVIRFGPGGVLLIGDGKGSQVIAVDVGGTEEKAGFKDSIERIDAKIAAKLGGTTKEVEIVDLAVNPASHVGFIAVRKAGKPILLTIDGSGKVGEFALENVKHVRVSLPKGEKSPLSRITDLAW